MVLQPIPVYSLVPDVFWQFFSLVEETDSVEGL